MITRAKVVFLNPKLYNVSLDTDEPCTYQQAIQSEKWKESMDEEYTTLMKNKTWSLVTIPSHKNVICKWTYRLKRNADVSIAKYKARLVARLLTTTRL